MEWMVQVTEDQGTGPLEEVTNRPGLHEVSTKELITQST